mgnify:CR=1 FL=1
MSINVIIFDFGGVITESPIIGFRRLEKNISLDYWNLDSNPTRFGLSLIDSATDNLRIKQPYIRKGWLENKGICDNNCICEGNCSQYCNCLCDKTHTSNSKYSGELDMKAMMLDLLKDGKYSQWKYKDFVFARLQIPVQLSL